MRILTVAAISLWLGVMAFFSFVAAPALFTTLDRESAGRVVATVLPRYYLFGVILEAVALVAVAGRVALGRKGEWGAAVLVLLMLGLTAYSMLVLLPEVESARLAMRSPGAPDEMLSQAALAFGRAHRLSASFNLLTMLAGLALVFIETLRARR